MTRHRICVIDSLGKLSCAGSSGGDSTIGDGNKGGSVDFLVSPLSDVVAFDDGGSTACAIYDSGKAVSCWGDGIDFTNILADSSGGPGTSYSRLDLPGPIDGCTARDVSVRSGSVTILCEDGRV